MLLAVQSTLRRDRIKIDCLAYVYVLFAVYVENMFLCNEYMKIYEKPSNLSSFSSLYYENCCDAGDSMFTTSNMYVLYTFVLIFM